MRIQITSHLCLTDCHEELRAEICARLAFTNPEWQENERMGRWNGNTKRLLRFYSDESGGRLTVPRGFIGQLLRLCRQFNAPYSIDDRRNQLPPVDFQFSADLRPYQTAAVDNMLHKHFGTLAAPTGSGKTIMALAIIARRRQPALVVAHTKELLNQWRDRIETFLGVPRKEIGIVGACKHTIGDRITIALVQSLYKCADEIAPHVGHLIVDECHRAPSRTFTEAVTGFDSKFMLGLSATPWRRDKLSRLIFWHLGDVQHQVDAAHLLEEGAILQAEVITRETQFKPVSDPSAEYSRMLSELTGDDQRNLLIASDIAKEAETCGGICLALSDRKAHCDSLQRILKENFGCESEVLTGDLPAGQREALVERLNAGGVSVLIATGQLIGEGFDCRELSTLFLATPIRFSGRVLQYLGRVLRPAPGKGRPRVYDYVDKHVGPLVAAAKARRRVYENSGGAA